MTPDLVCRLEPAGPAAIRLSVHRGRSCCAAGLAPANSVGLERLAQMIEAANDAGQNIALSCTWPASVFGAYTLRQRLGQMIRAFPKAPPAPAGVA